MTENELEERMFWLDGYTGYGNGGYFIRNDLKTFFEKLKKAGLEPCGIKFDGSFNIEIFVKIE